MDDDADAPEDLSAAEDLDDGHSGAHQGAAVAEPTGHPAVDAVLASLEGLEQRPVGEHVAVFEDAHDTLRGALNDAGEG